MSDTEKNPNDPIFGTIEKGGFISEEPSDVDQFLTDVGIKEAKYVCTIKKAPTSGSGVKEFLPITMKGEYPEIEELGRRFGPGQYFYCFGWITRDVSTDGKNVKKMKEYKVYLGEAWADIHDEFMSEKWKLREEKIIKEAQQKKMRDASRGILPNNNEVNAKDPIEDLKNTMGLLKDLGVPIAGGANPPAKDNNDVSMMALMMNMQQKTQEQTQQSNKDSMNMFMTMNTNIMTMMMGMMQNNKPQSNGDMMKEVFNMITGAVDMKNALNPAQETVVDKVFGLLQSTLPAIMALAGKPKAQRQGDPLVEMVKGSDDFASLQSNPNMLNSLIKKWEDAHGKEKTDVILETVGLTRPSPDGSIPQQAPAQQGDAEYTHVSTPENSNPMEDETANV